MNIPESVKHCKDCKVWHKYCNSECCKTFYLNINPIIEYLPNTVYAFKITDMSDDLKKYFECHNVQFFDKKTLMINSKDFVVNGSKILVNMKCKHLDSRGNCKVYRSIFRPKICEYPNWHDFGEGKVVIPKICMYNWEVL